MQDWQIRQKHYTDIQATHQRLGHMDDKGRIRTFRGKPFFEAIRQLGHDSGLLESCRCWKEGASSG